MPEEKKKDSFTFSDKIKNSKPAPSKGFGNRISSKIGSDGKPKKTLFERTKRDAPFFIAAIVALLLLPFLYKYSGSVNEEPVMVTPGSEDSVFNPDERFGFDASADPDGQIAQLSGRDPLSLIKGWGSDEPKPVETDYLGSIDRSGLSDDYSSRNTDVQENNTNIYRRSAKPATRAAFKRANTKIGDLRSASMTGRSGGKLGVGMWGGGMKAAAKKVRPDAPKSAPKPVSLQPLQAAGKPSRSYFGQGAAAQARKSKDALSKANAMQALMDAQFKPVEPGKIGGIGAGDFGGPGGGNGSIGREFHFNGKEPWWWDMMKKRSQMEWEAEFKRKWDWINWGDKLAQDILGGLLKCLITGNSDGDPDTFLGSGGGAGAKDEKCCGITKDGWVGDDKNGYDFSPSGCKKYYKALRVVHPKACPSEWEGGRPANAPRVGFFRQRFNCIGLAVAGKYGSGAPGMGNEDSMGTGGDCERLAISKTYSTLPKGEAMKWNKYHYVVARNYVVWDVGEGENKIEAKKIFLCNENSTRLEFTKKKSSGYSNIEAAGQTATLQEIDRLLKNWNVKDVHGNYNLREGVLNAIARRQLTCNPKVTKESKVEDVKKCLQQAIQVGKVNKKNTYVTFENMNRETVENACVIYVGESEIFDYAKFKTEMKERLKSLAAKQNVTIDEEAAFNKLDLFFIETMFSKHPLYDTRLGYGRKGMSKALPILFWQFQEAFIFRRGTSTNLQADGRGTRVDVENRKYRIFDAADGDVDTIVGHRCMFSNVNIACDQNSNPATATVTYSSGFQGDAKKDITVKATMVPFRGVKHENEQIVSGEAVVDELVGAQKTGNKTQKFTFSNPLVAMEEGSSPTAFNPGEHAGTVTWNVYRSGELVSTASCDFNNDGGNAPAVKEPVCQCGALTPSDKEWKTIDYGVGGTFSNNLEVCCASCATQLGTKHQLTDGQCIVPDEDDEEVEEESSVKYTRLAPFLGWIPSHYQQRGEVAGASNPSESTFTGEKLIPGKEYKNCGEKVGSLPIDVGVAKDFVSKVVASYNEKQPQLQIKQQEGFPTVGEFVDALNIAESVGISEVPKQAVCALARRMTQYSFDPHTDPNNDFKGDSDVVPAGKNNELGAYLTYVTIDANYYPASATEGQCDQRFITFRQGNKFGHMCRPVSVLNDGGGTNSNIRKYEWTNYTYMDSNQPVGARYYKQSRSELGIGDDSFLPLKALADGHSFAKDEDFGYLVENSSGETCSTLNGSMEVSDVLAYVTTACRVGLDAKPYGVPGARGRSASRNVKRGKKSKGSSPIVPPNKK